MKNQINLLVMLILSMLTITVVSANGLQINPSAISVNQTYGYTQIINFTITNTENFGFSNISFAPNPYITMPSIPSLASGQNITVNATITANSEISSANIHLRGYYLSNIGTTNTTWNVTINPSSNGFLITPCNIVLTQGDFVTFYNLDPVNSYPIINVNSGAAIASVSPNSSTTLQFTNPTSLSYTAQYAGSNTVFPTCTLTVLSTTGMINNPEKDGILTMNVGITYLPTSIVPSILTNDYTVSVGNSVEDIMKITNAGNQTAKSVHLSGTWFTQFSANDFDLAPGESKNIGYTISPQVSNTNDTNKTYDQTLFISGNFPQVNSTFHIFVPYSNLVNNANGSSITIRELVASYIPVITAYCTSYPDDTYCSNLYKNIIIGNNSNSQQGTDTVSLARAVNLLSQQVGQKSSVTSQQYDALTSNQNETNSHLNQIDTNFATLSNKFDTYNVAVILETILIFTALLTGILLFVVKKWTNKNKLNDYARYH